MPEATFNYDYLKQLVRQDPATPRRQLALAVTEHEREVRKDPGYPVIKDATIGAVLSRYRATWLDEGDMPALPPRKHSERSQPWDNLPPRYWAATPIRRIRMMTRIADNAPNLPKTDVQLALNLCRQLQRDRQVIDLLASGRPYTRDARPDELDSTGEIIWFCARYPGLTSQMWASLSPEERRIASLHWLPPGREPGPRLADLRPYMSREV